MVAGITSFSPIASVPIVVSMAGAIANGLCYYAFYAKHPTNNTVVAGAIADLTWLIQEAGLSFYSYLILIRVLRRRDRVIFMSLFWSFIGIITSIRIVILVSRARQIVSGTTNFQQLIDHLHVGYFSSIAVLEIISAFFLLRKFASAKKSSGEVAPSSGLFSYLMRSTEIRLAGLALIGITRAVTISFQTTAQSATSVASQIDRFVYTLECVFPIVMLIDILASKLVITNHIHNSSSHTRPYGKSGPHQNGGTGPRDATMYSMNNIATTIDAAGPLANSRERIVEVSRPSRLDTRGSEEGSSEIDRKDGGISKTVEFEFRESAVLQ